MLAGLPWPGVKPHSVAVTDKRLDGGRQADASAEVRRQQLARVDSLMAVVSDVMGVLGRSSTQLLDELKVLVDSGGSGDDPDRAGVRQASDELIRACVALQSENEQLRAALVGRAVIEQAKGILMVRLGCAPEEAFDLLCELSRRQRRKVRELAAEVVGTRGGSLAAQPEVGAVPAAGPPASGPPAAVPPAAGGDGIVIDLRDGKGAEPRAG